MFAGVSRISIHALLLWLGSSLTLTMLFQSWLDLAVYEKPARLGIVVLLSAVVTLLGVGPGKWDDLQVPSVASVRQIQKGRAGRDDFFRESTNRALVIVL